MREQHIDGSAGGMAARAWARRFALGERDRQETQRTNGTKLEGGEAPTSRDIGGEGRARFPTIPNYLTSALCLIGPAGTFDHV